MESKKMAGERAVDYVEDGMRLGLGTGSTVYWTIMKLGDLVKQGLRVHCVPTSKNTETLAQKLGIPLLAPSEVTRLDLAIDGADEVNPSLELIKGGGGALLREKIVASMADRFIVVVDETKCVPVLGAFPLPVEVVPFAWENTRERIVGSGCSSDLRIVGGEIPFITDNGNYILDCKFASIDDAGSLHTSLKSIPGVVETGLFVDMADTVIVAGKSGVDIKSRR